MPPNSSLGPFAEDMRRVIPGNHLTMLNATSADDPCVQMILQTLTRGAAPAGPRSAARLAVEEGKFHKVIETQWPVRMELDDTGMVSLALALDAVGNRRTRSKFWRVGRRREPMRSACSAEGTSAAGSCSGAVRTRRRRSTSIGVDTKIDRQDAAGSRAGLLSRHQSRLHGARLWRRLPRGERAGDEGIEHCRLSENPRDQLWRIATEADAQLILGHTDEGIAKHAEAAKLPMQPWQALSIQEQAMRTADLSGCSPEQIGAIAALYEGRT